MQIQLTGFLEKETAAFCKELWKLCLSAQTSPQGVPQELLEAKKLELIQEKVAAIPRAQRGRLFRTDDFLRSKPIKLPKNHESAARTKTAETVT
jgi:serine/arginine repetitive matrix protein 1